jgi:hypothetical protein
LKLFLKYLRLFWSPILFELKINIFLNYFKKIKFSLLKIKPLDLKKIQIFYGVLFKVKQYFFFYKKNKGINMLIDEHIIKLKLF